MSVAGEGRDSGVLYLRGVPAKLARAAKAAAAARGVTLTKFVIEALQEKLGSEVASAPSNDAVSALQSEMEWFEANRARLLEVYAGKYVAIVDQQVVDADHDFAQLARRIFGRLGPRPVFMPKVTPGERTIRAPSPWVARS